MRKRELSHRVRTLGSNFRSFVRRHVATPLAPLLFRKAGLAVQLRSGIALSGLLTFGFSAEAVATTFTACVVGPQDSLPGCVSGPEPVTMREGFQARSLGGNAFFGSGQTNLGTGAESTPLGLRANAGFLLGATGTQGRAGGGGSATAAVVYDDFLVNASGVSFVPGSLNLLLSGSLSTSATARASGGLIANAFAAAGVTVNMLVNGTFFEGGAAELRSPSGVSYDTYGPLTDLTFPAPFTITTPVLNLPVGTAFSLQFELSPFVGANAIIGGTPEDEFAFADFFMDSFSNFDSTLTFPTSGPVFNLPEGATVNSPSALIVNNRFVGGGPSAVPEPSSIFLFGLGLGVIGLGARARKRRLHRAK